MTSHVVAADHLAAAIAYTAAAQAGTRTGRDDYSHRNITQARRALDDAEAALTGDQPTRRYLAIGAPDQHGIRPFGGVHVQPGSAHEAAERLGPGAEVFEVAVVAPWELTG